MRMNRVASFRHWPAVVLVAPLLLIFLRSAPGKAEDELEKTRLAYLVSFIELARNCFTGAAAERDLSEDAVRPVLKDLDDLERQVKLLLAAKNLGGQFDTDAAANRPGIRQDDQRDGRPVNSDSYYPASFKSINEQRAYNLRRIYRLLLSRLHTSGGRLKADYVDETDIVGSTGGGKLLQCPVDERHREFGYVLPYSVLPCYHGDVMVYEIAADPEGKRAAILADDSIRYLTDKELAAKIQSGIRAD